MANTKLLKYVNDVIVPILNEIEYKLIDYKFFYKEGEFVLSKIVTTKQELIKEMNSRNFRQVILTQYLLNNLVNELLSIQNFQLTVKSNEFAVLTYNDEIVIVLNDDGTVSLDHENDELIEIVNDKLFRLIK